MHSSLKISFTNLGSITVFEILHYNIKYHIVPVYINCSRWTNDFLELTDCINALHSTKNILIIGDFNARTSNNQSMTNFAHVNRMSKDRVCNGEGNKLLQFCNEFQLVILNGSCPSDMEGDLTFIGGNGSSVIDYVLCGESWYQMVKKINIENQTFSDHFPVSIEFFIQGVPQQASRSVTTKLVWKQKNVSTYQDRLRVALRDAQHMDIEMLDSIIARVGLSLNKSSMNVLKC